jgi:Glucuronyl esterase, fungi
MRFCLVAFFSTAMFADGAEPAKPPFYADKANLLVYLDADGKAMPIKTPADWQKRRDHILANMQLVMGPLPDASKKVPLDLKVEGEETLDKVIRKKITFAVEKDDRVTAYLLIPKKLAHPKSPAMLCLHQTTRIGKGEPAGVGGLPNLRYALELAERGYVTLAPDYPNYGDYKFDPYANGYVSATMKGIWNHMRAVDLLQSLKEVDGERIGVIGHSLGGHNSLFVAAFEPRIKVVVTSCGFNSFAKYVNGDLRGWSHKGYMPRIASEYGASASKMPFDFTEILGVLAPRAVFINAPLRDDNFEVSGVRDCVIAADPVYHLLDPRGEPLHGRNVESGIDASATHLTSIHRGMIGAMQGGMNGGKSGPTQRLAPHDRLEATYPSAGHDFPPATRLQAYAFIDRHLWPRLEFTRMIAHWAEYGDDDYLKFVEEARPEICQVGFYGAHFWSLAHTPQFKGYPAHFPVQGLKECGSWHQERNSEIHKRGAKVVGHFNTTFLVGEPDGAEPLAPPTKGQPVEKGPRGFFKFYTEMWDEKELGPKPVADPMLLLARHADGTPMASKQYSIGQMREYTACLNNPYWRAVLKAWAKRGIERGVDGYMINYFYRHNCLCDHCQKGFREYLGERFTAEQLRTYLQIADLKNHKFTEIIGWHNPAESTPLRREMLRWSQICCKQAFDEVFVQYARSLKPGLLLGQWNHLGNFNQINGDERCMLPGNMWGRDEDYLWYSTGGAAHYTDLAEGMLGEGTLQARYIRGAFDDKPYTLGKYESTRTRVTIAELAANGGAPFGFYARHKDPEARKEIARYFGFMAKYDALFKANRSHTENLLLYPRSRIHQGDVAAIESFRTIGKLWLDEHVLFDVLPDDRLTDAMRSRYQHVTDVTGPNRFFRDLSLFKAPETVRISASRPATGNEIDLHFVNYNREEPKMKKSAGGGIKDEKPIAVEGVTVDFVLPKDAKVSKVSVISPEFTEAATVEFKVKDGRVQFTVPKFLVYAMARIDLNP